MSHHQEKLAGMLLTLLGAVLCGLILEAEGLRIWADRLPVGWLRDAALPVATRWYEVSRPLQFAAPRQWALAGKARLAEPMLRHGSSETAVADQEPTTAVVSVQSQPGSAASAVEVPALTLTTRLPEAASAIPATQSAVAGRRHAPLGAQSAPEIGVQTVRVSSAATMQLAPLGLTHEVQVALAGDSMMAVGLAPTLTRGLAPEKTVHLLRAYRSGTGLARPEVFDWLVEYPRMLGQAKPDLIICAMGGNDAQNVQVGKQVLQYGSAEWDDFFRQRLTAYLDMLTREHAKVLWLGMPVMKAPAFSQKMSHMNEIVRATTARYASVTWLDMNSPLGYAKQGFEQYRSNEQGKLIKLRADDGIHLTDDGASYLLMPIREWLAHAAGRTDSADAPVVSAAPPLSVRTMQND